MNLVAVPENNNNSPSGSNKNLMSSSVSALRKSMESSVQPHNEDGDDPNNSEEKKDDQEDIGIKIIACENFQSFLTILHVGNSIVIYEITYRNDEGEEDLETDITLQLYISTFS